LGVGVDHGQSGLQDSRADQQGRVQLDQQRHRPGLCAGYLVGEQVTQVDKVSHDAVAPSAKGH
jgi:hypothetical protein